MRQPTSRQLRIIDAIARAGKISGAAEALHVSAPAVTLQLQQIELLVGMPLFERSKRLMRPTPAGQLLVDCARIVEDRIGSCVAAIDGLRGLGSGRVSIGVISTAKYFAPAALKAFTRGHPQIDLRLLVVNRGDLIKALSALDIDLAMMGRPPEGMAVESAVLGDHPHVIVAAPDHPLARRKAISIDQLAGETLLSREEGSGTRVLTETFFSKATSRPRASMEISSNETIKQAVMAGLGIALISAHTIAIELAMGRIVCLDVLGMPIVRQWHIVRHADKRIMPAAAALWAFLGSEGRSYLP